MKNNTTRMTCTEDGHSKEWSITLTDNGDVTTTWGKIDGPQQSKLFEGVGRAFVDAKLKEKTRKGYILDNE
jgi:hypothetical protein